MQRSQEQQLSVHRGAYRDGRACDYNGIAQDVVAPSTEGSMENEMFITVT